MIKVDFAEIEKLTDILVKLASDADEALNKLRQVSNEMHNDLELPAYPQSPAALEDVSVAIGALNRGNDTLQTLKAAMLPVASAYQETESRHRAMLSRITVMMEHMTVGYNAAMVSENIPHIGHTDAVLSQGKVQQLVGDSADQMQITNIAALTKSVREEYEISAVAELSEEV